MKKYFLLIALGLMMTASQAQVKFIHPTNWDTLLINAKAEDKLIFLDAYTDWCGWCKVMDSKTFADTTVAAFMNEHFVNTKLEMQKEALGRTLSRRHRVYGFPTFLIFDNTGKLLLRIEGFQAPEEFLKTLKEVTDKQVSNQ